VEKAFLPPRLRFLAKKRSIATHALAGDQLPTKVVIDTLPFMRARPGIILPLLLSVLLSMACAHRPSTAEGDSARFGLTRKSPGGHFLIEVIPPQHVPVQRIHAWSIRIQDSSGQPLSDALVYVNGGMPEHGHGMPTRPQVTKEVLPGIYEVQGMKFNMSGEWEILVAVQKGTESDVTAFRYLVRTPQN
jgi:hypothetical protein